MRTLTRMIFTFIALLLGIALLILYTNNVDAFKETISIVFKVPYAMTIGPYVFPIWSLLLMMLTLGFFFTFFLELIAWVKIREEIASYKRAVKSLEKDLGRLRSSSFSPQPQPEKPRRKIPEETKEQPTEEPEMETEIPG